MSLLSSQGGSFDVADRMFHSVKGAWESASRENMSDVRELTPEFFFLPEFLTNCNAVEFGEQGLGGGGSSPQLRAVTIFAEQHSPQPHLRGSASWTAQCYALTPSPVCAPIYQSPAVSHPSGCMQDGTALGDVQLPPWADGDPGKFISLHRQVS